MTAARPLRMRNEKSKEVQYLITARQGYKTNRDVERHR